MSVGTKMHSSSLAQTPHTSWSRLVERQKQPPADGETGKHRALAKRGESQRKTSRKAEVSTGKAGQSETQAASIAEKAKVGAGVCIAVLHQCQRTHGKGTISQIVDTLLSQN